MGMREMAMNGTVNFGPVVRGGMVGRGTMPIGWANTAVAIAYQYQFDRNSDTIFSRQQMETYGHTSNAHHMDELRKIFLSCFFTRLRAQNYTLSQARVLCYVFYDVMEAMFLERLWKDIVKVLNTDGILKQPWERLEAEVVALLQQEKGAVRRRILNYHNTFGFSRGTLCYASFSSHQIQGIHVNMGQHGYAGSIYFPNGRIRLIHRHGPTVSQHNAVVRTVGNQQNERENLIIELQDTDAVLFGKTARIQNPCIYEYRQADLNHHVHVQVHGQMVRRRNGIRKLEVPASGWQRLSLAHRCNFHKSRGVPRKVTLNDQQIEVLFFIGENIKQMLHNPPPGAGEIAEAGNRFVLEYLNMDRAARQSLGYG